MRTLAIICWTLAGTLLVTALYNPALTMGALGVLLWQQEEV
jgi:hypothetical protein